MAPAVAVVDTPVVVAGLLSAESEPAARILDAMLAGAFLTLLSERLLAEYREVLLRRRVRKRHGLEEPEVDRLLTDLAQLARVVEPAAVAMPLIDPADAHLYHLLLSHRDARLVTADLELAVKVGSRAVAPREFVRSLAPSQGATRAGGGGRFQ